MSQPNVLLVVLDSVRAQNVGHLGYPRDTTPHLDEFAARATSYTNTRAPGIHSISSHVSLFTGYHVAEHRATSHGASLAPGHTIWEELADDGYRTGLFTPNAIVAESSNLASFFDDVTGPKRNVLLFPEALGPESISGDPSYLEYVRACLESESPAKAIVNGLAREFGSSSAAHDPEREHGGEYVQEFLEWRESSSDPWAACINLMDAHYPYLPQERYDLWGGDVLRGLHREAMGGPLTTQYLGDRPFWELEACMSLYDGCIKQADAYLSELFEGLEAANELEETLIVVTSDHGEGFGEYSVVNDAVRLIDHSWGIGNEVAHVPLVVKYPDQSTGETVTEPASLTRFPSVVRNCINGERGGFVPETGHAITTSYRIEEPGEGLPIPESDREPYFGPWHAVCHEQGGATVVDAVRREDEVRFESSIPDQQATRAHADREFIESTVDELDPIDITEADGEIEAAVEQRLHELGYRA
ncbi:sulfatase-like hydrolase/transferase [Natrinema longum]|uniref:Sulfatase-like hydrolase/transferase n=1 Tax=Natrinema longum TaxID=370324 RepID=A0A8A2U5W6_9EURY|nr:sulfatase-like hydrolase/transferase [Natrinema longum]MBZ6494566.1 sulfatase-like hydrolase/transferase [Natrinema longum]QSW84114.1 sulfatase-like hydrolase/transferase [Natrinema longum]